jgi:hypothetical protein
MLRRAVPADAAAIERVFDAAVRAELREVRLVKRL